MSDTITVKCLQGWRGAVQVPSNATVGALVDSIVEAANLQQPSDVTSLIIKGRRLDPEAVRTKACAEVGVVNNTPIMLVIRSPTERAAAAAQDMQLKRMRAVEMAAAALSERVGLGPMDGGEYELQLTNQDGTEIKLAPTDRKGFSLGALLHAKAKALLTERSAEVVGALTSASIADAAGAEANASPPEPSVTDESDVSMAEPSTLTKPTAPPTDEADVSMDEPSTVGVCMPDTAPEASGEPPAAIDALTALGRALDDVEELLEQAESAFSLVSPRILALGDNAALCLLDCVWCSLLRRLIRRLLHRQTKLTKPTTPPTDEADESDHRQTKLTKPTARRPVGAAGGAGSRDTGSTADEDGAEMGEAERAKAATRLGRAKALLRELHGENLQRLAGRDDAGQHRAIYVRLYLLQGGLAMSGGERADAASLLHKADNLRRELTLGPQDAEKLCALVALGLTKHAARASLPHPLIASLIASLIDSLIRSDGARGARLPPRLRQGRRARRDPRPPTAGHRARAPNATARRARLGPTVRPHAVRLSRRPRGPAAAHRLWLRGGCVGRGAPAH
jgi:hypothetical protein